MGFFQAMHRKNLTLPSALVFVYMILPMVVSGVPEPEPRAHSIPDIAMSPVVADDPDLLGQGGPLGSLIYGFFDEPEDETPRQESEPIEIKVYNKLNYSNAIYPVFPTDISSDFGWREAPCDECSSDHHGVDFVPGHGAEVLSVLDGLVVEAGINGGFGTWVVVEHLVPSLEDDNTFEKWQTLYAHLQDGSIPSNVGVGSVVTKGQLIGLVGNTGVSTGSHLHFEILINGIPQSPLPLLSEYSKIEILADGTERFIGYE